MVEFTWCANTSPSSDSADCLIDFDMQITEANVEKRLRTVAAKQEWLQSKSYKDVVIVSDSARGISGDGLAAIDGFEDTLPEAHVGSGGETRAISETLNRLTRAGNRTSALQRSE